MAELGTREARGHRSPRGWRRVLLVWLAGADDRHCARASTTGNRQVPSHTQWRLANSLPPPSVDRNMNNNGVLFTSVLQYFYGMVPLPEGHLIWHWGWALSQWVLQICFCCYNCSFVLRIKMLKICQFPLIMICLSTIFTLVSQATTFVWLSQIHGTEHGRWLQWVYCYQVIELAHFSSSNKIRIKWNYL